LFQHSVREVDPRKQPSSTEGRDYLGVLPYGEGGPSLFVAKDHGCLLRGAQGAGHALTIVMNPVRANYLFGGGVKRSSCTARVIPAGETSCLLGSEHRKKCGTLISAEGGNRVCCRATPVLNGAGWIGSARCASGRGGKCCRSRHSGSSRSRMKGEKSAARL